MILIKSVRPGSPFDAAGFRSGDMILADLPPDEVLRQIDGNRGRNMTLTIASGSIAVMVKPLEKYPQQKLDVAVPLDSR